MNYPTFSDKYGAASPIESPAPAGAAGTPPAQPPQNPWSQQRDQRLDPWLADGQNSGVAMNPGAKV